MWQILEERACAKPHRTLEALKRSIVRAAAEIPLETIRSYIDDFPNLLKLCIKAKGGHFE